MNKLYLGVLSGTSMDAIDIAAVNFSLTIPSIYATSSTPLPSNYKERYLQIINTGNCRLEELGDLDNWTAELFANAINGFLKEHNIDKKDITAIGSHGQTLWHAPFANRPFTLQIGDPNLIAVKTGITTIADFRRANIAAGGQGAPLAPAFHQAVFSKAQEPRCIVNIGGFSNISVLENNKYFGFDPGPGNCLMDYWVKTHFNLDFDQDGKLAAIGKVNTTLLECCLADPYFKRSAPKSAGREYFNPAWLEDKIAASKQNDAAVNVLATLLQLTAQSISNAIKDHASSNTRVFICGGGAKNLQLLSVLSTQLEQTVLTTAELGIDPSWVEAALFAWLAKETVNGRTINLPTTGATLPVVLGGIYGHKMLTTAT